MTEQKKRGRGKAILSVTKTTDITFRLTEKQKNAISERAQQKGMNVSEYLRFLILKDLEENS